MVFPSQEKEQNVLRNSLRCMALIYGIHYVIFKTIHTRENGPSFKLRELSDTSLVHLVLGSVSRSVLPEPSQLWDNSFFLFQLL